MQNAPLLLTKLFIPQTRPEWVERHHLLARLDLVRQNRLALLTAPAGYGKTALLTQWIAHCDNISAAEKPCFAWFGLDENDNDPIRFWSYVLSALRNNPALDHLGVNFLEIFQSLQPPTLEQALPLLINEIALVNRDIILILDDYQVIHNALIHSGLGFFIEHISPNLHILIAGRSDPPLALPRLRARRQMVELHVNDLRFTGPEIAEFFNRAGGIALADEELTLVDDKAEGWIAGLQLALLSMEGHEDKHKYLNSFKGDDPYILDYLTEEILICQPPEIQQFLLNTSILPRLCAPLCEVLLEPIQPSPSSSGTPLWKSADDILAYLDRSNLFIIPLDHQRSWYRYHPLFADLLQARLKKQVGAEKMNYLQSQAAGWLAEHHFPLEAFSLARAAGDLALAFELFCENMPAMVAGMETTTLLSWVAAFPEAFILGHPELCLAHAWSFLYRFQFDQAEEWAVRTAQNSAGHPHLDIIMGQINTIRATVAINRSDFQQSISLSKMALADIPENMGLMRSLLYLNLGDSYSMRDEFSAAASAFQDALEVVRPSGNHMLEVIIIGSLGELYLRFGKLQQAEAILQQALTLEKKVGAEPLLACGKPLVYLSQIAIQKNQLQQAQDYATKALEYCQKWGHADHLMEAYINLVEVYGALGQMDSSLKMLSQARQMLDSLAHKNFPTSINKYRWWIETAELHQNYRQGNWAAIINWLEKINFNPDGPCTFSNFPAACLLAESWLVQDAPEKAVLLLESLTLQAHQNDWKTYELEALILLALAHLKRSDLPHALESLETSLRLACREGFIQCYLQKGPDLQGLLNKLISTLKTRLDLPPFQPDLQELIEYGQVILSAFPDEKEVIKRIPHAARSSLDHLDWNQALSQREVEIVKLVAAGMSNDEIAAALILSTNTIKTHLKRIYAKLNTTNRLETINKARQLKVI